MQVQGQFHALLVQHCIDTGAELPTELVSYLSQLLAERLTCVNVVLEPSFAERYLQLYTESRPGQFKDYADHCLFFTALLPEYGHRRGLNMDYYASLGISTYYTLGDMVGDNRYTQLGNWFYTLQRFLNTCIHGSKMNLWDNVRS